MSLEKLVAILSPIAGTGLLTWILQRWEKRNEAKKAALLKAKEIERRLETIENNYAEYRAEMQQANKELYEELKEVRADFAEFVQKLFFNK